MVQDIIPKFQLGTNFSR